MDNTNSTKTTQSKDKYQKRLSLQLAPQIDEMLRTLGKQTGLKYVTIISNGIKSEWVRMGGKEEGK